MTMHVTNDFLYSAVIVKYMEKTLDKTNFKPRYTANKFCRSTGTGKLTSELPPVALVVVQLA